MTRANIGIPLSLNDRLSSAYEDEGHTKTCPRCGEGHGNVKFLVGKQRSIEIQLCEPCVKKPLPKKTPAKPWLTLEQKSKLKREYV